MKFLVDMPLSPDLAQWLRAEGHDAVHAAELSMSQSPDSKILESATRSGRVVITADLDFPRLLAALGSTGPGLILPRGGNYSEAESRDCVRMPIAQVDNVGTRLQGRRASLQHFELRQRPDAPFRLLARPRGVRPSTFWLEANRTRRWFFRGTAADETAPNPRWATRICGGA